jgi:RNA polymerase sigma-70 factor, ECF subfamily
MTSPSHAAKPVIDDLMPVVYAELKRLAQLHLREQRPGHTLSATALVHEAWLKLRQSDAPNDRQHFMALAARAMRQILVNHALAQKAHKRDGGHKVSLAGVVDAAHEDATRNAPFEVMQLDQALARMEALDPRAAKLAELRAFAGLSLEESAATLAISIATAKRDWLFAKLWLARELARD